MPRPVHLLSDRLYKRWMGFVRKAPVACRVAVLSRLAEAESVIFHRLLRRHPERYFPDEIPAGVTVGSWTADTADVSGKHCRTGAA